MPKIHKGSVQVPPTPSLTTTPKAKAKPVRDSGELSVVWKGVRTVEAQVANRTPGFDALKNSSDFQQNDLGNLKAFLDHGKSSLTPYEARVVGQGLGFRDCGGYMYGNTPTTHDNYVRGDRVEFTLGNEQGQPVKARGIVADISQSGELRVLHSTPGGIALDYAPDAKVITPGLDDGRS
jgi:hypothetical protein